MRTAMLFVLVTTLLAFSFHPAHADEAGAAGFWDGSIALPGMSLGIRVHLLRNDTGAWRGTIDIPMQGAKDLALSDVTVDGDAVSFVIAGVPGAPTFTGTRDGDAISGSFSQNGQTFPFTLTRGTDAAPGRPQDPKPPFPYSNEDVTFENGDVTLAGTLTVPDGDGPFPAVVLLTGSGPQNRNEEIFNHRPFLVIADYLSRHGVAVLRYDDRGVGESTGDINRSTTADFAQDALAAVDLLRRDARIDAGRIGLVGHSEGAMSGPMAAARSDRIAFLVLLAAPGVPAPELLALQAERIARVEGESDATAEKVGALNRELTAAIIMDNTKEGRAKARDVILRQNDLIPENSRPAPDALERMVQSNIDNLFAPWFQYFIRCDPRESLRKVKVPVLALFGGLDLQVAAAQNRPALEAALAEAGNTDVTVRTLPGLNHLFQHAGSGTVSEYGDIDETISPEVLDVIGGWIAERFGAGR